MLAAFYLKMANKSIWQEESNHDIYRDNNADTDTDTDKKQLMIDRVSSARGGGDSGSIKKQVQMYLNATLQMTKK